MLVLAVEFATASFQVITWGHGDQYPGGLEVGQNILMNYGATCTASWICSSFDSCSYTDTRECLAMTDVNSCGGNFTGNISQYDVSCSFCDENEDVDVCEVKKMYQIAIILLPIIFGFFCLIGAWTMGERHTVFKIFLFLLSIVSVFASFTIAMEVINGTSGTITEMMARMMTWMVWAFIAILFYWLIYAIYVMIKRAAQDREEQLRY